MLFRYAINAPEDRQPREAEQPGDDECGTPGSERLVQAEDQERRERAADGRTAVEQRDGPSALAAREPLRHGLGRPRPVRGLAGAEQETEAAEAPEAGRQ